MRVERLELNGFKSFSDKTVFKFHPGTTSIVGPNGCGKSNIVDAFKWVLGEQSAKSLRGGSMEDVIFAGSATKKTKGMAEVTLVLSDILESPSNGSDSEETAQKRSQVSVTRRLYRSGESEYLMNKVPCRLKDIKNMFLDTGLELKAYSILEQGKIGDIVNSKPQDRRFLIEEVAGVMKYKVRKHEATNKLESSKANLQRLQDIIAEVKRQINTIDRHARKAERYKKIFEELKDIEVRIGKRDVQAFRTELANLSSGEDALKLREAEVSANTHAAEAMIEEKKRLCVEQEKMLDSIRTRLYALEKEAAEDEGKIALLKRDCDNLRDRNAFLVNQDRDLENEKQAALEAIGKIEADALEMEEELAKQEKMLEEQKEAFTACDSGIAALENSLEEQRRNLFNKAEEISSTRNEISHINLNIETINRKREKSSQDIDSLSTTLSSLVSTMDRTRSELALLESQLRESKASKDELITGLKDKKHLLSGSEESLYREREELAALNSKLESLKEMDQEERSALGESIKTLCRVADIFDTPAEYETAIEAVLGDKLGASVVENQQEMTRALQHIKEQKAKRSSFISRDLSDSLMSDSPEGGSMKEHSGVIGRAAQFVSVKEGFTPVALSLLQDVYLVDTLETAFSLLHESEPDRGRHGAFVTLDGEVLEQSGMVYGGTDRGVLKIKRLTKDLEHTLETKKESCAVIENTVRELKSEIVTIENEILSLDGKISSEEKYCHELQVRVSNSQEENERLRQKHEFMELEITDDQRELERLREALEERELRGKAREEEKQQIEDRIREIQIDLSGKRETRESMHSGLTELKLERTSLREKITANRREGERLRALIVEMDRKKAEMSSERTSIQESIARKEREVADKEEVLTLKVVSAGDLQAEASRVNEIIESRRAELELSGRQLKTLTQELEQIHSELSRLEMKKMEQSMKLEYLKEDIHKTYAIDIDTTDVSDAVAPEEEEKLPQLKERLQSIGPVSMGTLDEYDELKSRFDFLTQQRDDLLNSISDLEETIQKINRTSKKRLQEAYEALNEKFKEVFTVLFGKGRAELQLTEGSILDAGIEIIAQPPGKRLQNLNLLSGGEKALTALSLLFAGFMIKPTPLCLLDEVDAPLDESNTERFIKLLKEMARNIQFIAITHNRRTMEAADYLYGITMEEPGASKVISMHLAEAV